MSVKNDNEDELYYADIQIRLTGKPSQVDFISPPGEIDPEGNPRIYLSSGQLAPGKTQAFRVQFRARQDMNTNDMRFHTGFYGVIHPEGHHWLTLSPTE